ncbi:MAG: glycine betaine ABC transporter substrate-binding protein, partial [Vicinamibacteria bacterium]
GCGRPADGAGRPVIVGGTNFTEQVILGEMVSVLLEEGRSIPVKRRLDLGGTFICFNALRAGEIDLYVEYTGTALTAILKLAPTQDRALAYETVRDRFAKEHDLVWTEPLGFRNDFAIVVRPDDAARHSLKTISDLARAAPGMRAGFGPEFLSREDGFPGLRKTYDLRFRENPLQMDLGLLYRALEQKKVDVVAGNSTDGLIDAMGLVVLEDDRGYFPAYEAAPVARSAALAAHPGLREALASLGGAITAADMRRLNYSVDGQKREARQVARQFLRERGLIG